MYKMQAPRRPSYRVPARIHGEKLIGNKDLVEDLDDAFCVAMLETTEDASVEEIWRLFTDKLYSYVLLVVAKPERKNQDWFNDSNMEIKKTRRGPQTQSLTPNVSERRKARHNLNVRAHKYKCRSEKVGFSKVFRAFLYPKLVERLQHND